MPQRAPGSVAAVVLFAVAAYIHAYKALSNAPKLECVTSWVRIIEYQQQPSVMRQSLSLTFIFEVL